MKTILFFSFFSLLIGQAQSECIDGKIKINNRIQAERYCFDNILKTITSAKNCPDNKECFINNPGPYKLGKKITKENACIKLNGAIQKIDYWDKEKWVSASRCLFNDGSFSDINTLFLKVVAE